MKVKAWPNVILLGDSLTQRGFSPDGQWVSMLSNHLSGKCDVINRGFSGYNTRMVKHFIEKAPVQLISPDMAKRNIVTFVFLGANDSVEPNQGQHVPIDEYKSNLSDILSTLGDIGVPQTNLVLVPPPPCVEADWMKFIEERDGVKMKEPGKTLALTEKYHQACIEVANKSGHRYLPGVWEALSGDPAMFCDGLHFSSKGSETLAKLIIEYLTKSSPETPFVLPYWRQLFDSENQLVLP